MLKFSDYCLTICSVSVMIVRRRKCAALHLRTAKALRLYYYHTDKESTNEYKEVFNRNDIRLAVEEYSDVQPAAYDDAGAGGAF